MIKNWTIGSDIEFFVHNEATNEVISAEGYVIGTKTEPYRFSEDNPHWATSLDNVVLEGNIPPTNNKATFISHINYIREYLSKGLPEGFKPASMASARLDENQLFSYHSQQVGCDPSVNCWNFEEIQPSIHENLRTAGFHIHVGYTDPSIMTSMALGRAMDLFLTVPGLLIEPENERATAGYMQAGNIRFQEHGVELRTLSSWFSSSNSLIGWVFDNTVKAIDFVNKYGETGLDSIATTIVPAINNMDKPKLQQLIKQFNIPIYEVPYQSKITTS